MKNKKERAREMKKKTLYHLATINFPSHTPKTFFIICGTNENYFVFGKTLIFLIRHTHRTKIILNKQSLLISLRIVLRAGVSQYIRFLYWKHIKRCLRIYCFVTNANRKRIPISSNCFKRINEFSHFKWDFNETSVFLGCMSAIKRSNDIRQRATRSKVVN